MVTGGTAALDGVAPEDRLADPGLAADDERMRTVSTAAGNASRRASSCSRPTRPDSRSEAGAAASPTRRLCRASVGATRRRARADERRRGQERRGRDLNPRRACTLNGFRDRPVRPLRHPSERGKGSARRAAPGGAENRMRASNTCEAAGISPPNALAGRRLHGVGEPMVPPRAPSLGTAHGSRRGWPPGRQSRPPAARARAQADRASGGAEKEGFEPSRQGFPHLTP